MSDDLLQRAEAFIEIEVKTLPLQVQLNGITDAEGEGGEFNHKSLIEK